MELSCVKNLARIVILIAATAVATSCSLRSLAVNNFEWVSTRAASSYLDLNDEQEQEFQSQLKAFVIQFDQQHLKPITESLNAIVKTTNPEATIARLSAQLKLVTGSACDSFAPTLASLSKDQQMHLRKKLAESNEELDPNENGEWKEIRAKAQQRQIKSLRQWLGRLEDDQLNQISTKKISADAISINAPGDSDWNDSTGRRERRHLAYREEAQSSFLAILDRNNGQPEKLRQECRQFVEKPELYLNGDALKFAEQRRLIRNSTFIILLPTLTPAQKIHLQKEVDKVIADARTIILGIQK